MNNKHGNAQHHGYQQPPPQNAFFPQSQPSGQGNYSQFPPGHPNAPVTTSNAYPMQPQYRDNMAYDQNQYSTPQSQQPGQQYPGYQQQMYQAPNQPFYPNQYAPPQQMHVRFLTSG